MLQTAPDRESKNQTSAEEIDELYCSACGHLVTRARWRLSRKGDHQHTVFNPAGRLFRIVCFSDAPGAAPEGTPSDEFTWFPGYKWLIAICRNCGRHMGWQFVGGDIFFALIKSHLTDKKH
ncbi:MAG: hypothetical protein CMM10_18660 [Rhodospirillaceae bacterium]|jgi:hypothetical protein|nr:hypothetical protein [Rhodospirillaceae bacterium]MDP6646745.1 cereblon family protein [Rhodospirillales bacterium]